MRFFNGRYFISLRWKLVAGVLVLLTSVGLVLGVFTYKQLINQQSYLLGNQQQRLAQNLTTSMRLAIDRASLAALQLSSLLGKPHSNLVEAQAPSRVVTHEELNELWPDLQLFWDLNSLSIINKEGRVDVHAGASLSGDDYVWFTSSLDVLEPSYRFHCRDICTLQVLIPTILNGQMHYILLESGLTDILNRFRINDEFELAVLGPEQTSLSAAFNVSPYWNRKLYSLSNRTESESVLREATKQWTWSELAKGDGVYDINNQPWALWVFPFEHNDKNSPVLLVLSNISNWHALLYQFQQNLLGTLLFAVLLCGGLIMVLVWSPVRRLGQHAQMLPLLAEHKFDELRQALPKKGRGLIDEVDLVNIATHRLADRLQGLEGEVDSYTKELERLAMLDTLTGLPNRAMLLHELNKAVACVGRIHNQIAIMFLDLDEFKRINDTLGHSIGDDLLKIVAARLGNSVRAMDTVFRQGGDEFIILLRGMKNNQDVRKVIHKIFASLQQPIVLGKSRLTVTTSIGVVFCKSQNVNSEELIKQAELAMYQAKEGGKSNYRVFTQEMLQQANNRLMVEQDIGLAVEEHQLSLFLQPIVALPDGKLKGFEALIRWFHPERGLIMPGNFIPDIEQSDAIIDVGNYVLAQGVAMLERFRREGYEDIYLAVNLSARHYLASGLTKYIKILLEQHGVPPACLLLEVTEESVIQELDKALVVMRELKDLGVRIAIDDFGTGYSSLSYLKQLPFDVLKIDRCFTSGVLEGGVDTHIVTTVIDLAHNMDRTVVAEGVETQEQNAFLARAGCELAQGYYYAKPQHEEKVFELLSQMGDDNIWPKDVELISPARKLGS